MSFYWFETLKKNTAGGGLRKNANPGHTGMQINTAGQQCAGRTA